MSWIPGVNRDGSLNGVGLSAVIGGVVGTLLLVSLVSNRWIDSMGSGSGLLLVLCVYLVPFGIALGRYSPGVRSWLARLTRARRVSLCLFVGVVILFAVSQLPLYAIAGRVAVRLEQGGLWVNVWQNPSGNRGVWVEGLLVTDAGSRAGEVLDGADFPWDGPVGMRLMPVVAHYDIYDDHIIAVMMPLWLPAMIVLWPWWKPRVSWLLGGRLQGHAPLRSWHYRLALGAVVLCAMVFCLSYQDLLLPIGQGGLLRLNEGWILVTQQPPGTQLRVEGGWWLSGYHTGPSSMWRGALTIATAWNVWIPAWGVLLGSLLWLILAVRPPHRYRRRWENGLCLHCGYDLRGLKERCTECGQPIEPERLAQLAGVGDLPESGAGGGRRAADP